jgi:uncharacterized protein YcbK (DUF882 family)
MIIHPAPVTASTVIAGWRWPHFTPAEMCSKGDGSLVLAAAAMDALERARMALGEPFVILSAYRDPLHNARVGGAPLSRHKAGDAFDIALAGHRRGELRAACAAAGFRGFGLYKVFLHIDMGPKRSWGKWT